MTTKARDIIDTLEKLSNKQKRDHEMALTLSRDRLAKAKKRYAATKSQDDKDAIDFWQDKIISTTKKMKEA